MRLREQNLDGRILQEIRFGMIKEKQSKVDCVFRNDKHLVLTNPINSL